MSHAFWLDIYNLQVPGNAFLVTEENKVTFELYIIEGMNEWLELGKKFACQRACEKWIIPV